MKTARHEDGSSCAPIILLTDDTYRGIIYQMDILCPLPKLNDAEDSSFLCHIPSSYMIRIYKSKKKKRNIFYGKFVREIMYNVLRMLIFHWEEEFYYSRACALIC